MYFDAEYSTDDSSRLMAPKLGDAGLHSSTRTFTSAEHSTHTRLTLRALTESVLVFPLFGPNAHRATLKGRIAHVDDRYSTGSNGGVPLAVSVSASVSYLLPKPPFFPGQPDRLAVCSHVFTTNVRQTATVTATSRLTRSPPPTAALALTSRPRPGLSWVGCLGYLLSADSDTRTSRHACLV